TKMKRTILATALLIISFSHVFAKGDPPDSILQMIEAYAKLRDSVNSALKYETGLITLPAGVVKLNVPAGFKFLGQEQSKYVIEDLWGNLPQENIQGMLFPANSDPFDDSSYAYIITYSPVGYVKDGDAKDINYDDLMKDMKKDDAEENARRK